MPRARLEWTLIRNPEARAPARRGGRGVLLRLGGVALLFLLAATGSGAEAQRDPEPAAAERPAAPADRPAPGPAAPGPDLERSVRSAPPACATPAAPGQYCPASGADSEPVPGPWPER